MKTGIVGTGLITPLGTSPEDVFSAIREGKSALSLHPGFPEPFFASLLPRPAVRLFADEVVKEQDRHNKKAGVSESAKGHSYPANLIHQLEIQAI